MHQRALMQLTVETSSELPSPIRDIFFLRYSLAYDKTLWSYPLLVVNSFLSVCYDCE
jgi:hypothetical protein